ncbi:MAG: hypothetical protein ACK4NF_03265, partial [Planctomycetota bacterium]
SVGFIKSNLADADVCESCTINIGDKGKVAEPKTVIEKIYDFFYSKVFQIHNWTNQSGAGGDMIQISDFEGILDKALQYFQYFLGIDAGDKLAIISELRKAGQLCTSTAAGATESSHFNCCWSDGKDSGCTEKACSNCLEGMKQKLYTAIKDKLEGVCKAIGKCKGKKSESECKNSAGCKWESNMCKEVGLPKVETQPIKIDIGSLTDVEVPQDFFSSQYCGSE